MYVLTEIRDIACFSDLHTLPVTQVSLKLLNRSNKIRIIDYDDSVGAVRAI